MDGFGQPGCVYDGESSLIAAVAAYPQRFSPETREFVGSLVAKAVEPPTSIEQ